MLTTSDFIVLASDDGTAGNPKNQYAWTTSKLDYTSNPANYDPAIDIMKGPLWPYYKNEKIYRCPADHSLVKDASGISHPRVRTISMNFFLGGFAGGYGGWGAPVSSMNLYFKTTDLSGGLAPGAVKTFLFLDEREDVINWGNFMTDMTGYSPNNPAAFQFNQDLPGMYHNRACGFSFCDGHAEIKKWLDGRTTPPINSSGYPPMVWPVPRDVDVAWLQDRTVRPK